MMDNIARSGIRMVEGYFGFLKFIGYQATLVDEALNQLAGQGEVPPMHLRMRVHGRPDLGSFLDVGSRCAQDLQAALATQGKHFADFGQILDFGCGSGRTLRWVTKLAPQSQLYGTDIDGDAIAWVQRHLDYVSASVNGQKAPLPYPGDSFDLIYSISVFTHMDEEHQFFWLEELRRVMRPGGLLLASLHGHDLWKAFPPEALNQLQQEGVFVAKTRLWDGVFPEWYQNTYHSVEYVTSNFGKYFDVVDYLPLALDANHDIAILRKR